MSMKLLSVCKHIYRTHANEHVTNFKRQKNKKKQPMTIEVVSSIKLW